MSDIFTRGHKCMFKGQKIVGDGQHTREQLYLKVMAAKPKPVKLRYELRRGEKAMHKGQKIVGDGESTNDELYDKLMADKPKPVKPRYELRKGEKAMHKGQSIIGDGESTNDELYDKLMAGKKPKKRGLAETQTMPKVTEPETIEKVVTKKKKSKKYKP